jgi:hypothetical protein
VSARRTSGVLPRGGSSGSFAPSTKAETMEAEFADDEALSLLDEVLRAG